MARSANRTGVLDRVGRAWRSLHGEQRLVALAALALFGSLFLPWYEKSALPAGAPAFVTDSVSAFGAFSFVEAAVLLISSGVLALLFMRAEGRAFHLPGGDGTVIAAAGAWAALLIVWRMFDKPQAAGVGATVGIQWGVFVALAAACFLAYAGQRVRQAHRPEPPLPTVGDPVVGPAATSPATRRRRRTATPPQSSQLFSPDAPPEPETPPEPDPEPDPDEPDRRPSREFFPAPEPPEEAPPPPRFGR